MFHLLVALQLAGAKPTSFADSAAVVRRLRGEGADFAATWRNAWEESERARHIMAPRLRTPHEIGPRSYDVIIMDRLDHLHCHPNEGDPATAVQQMLNRFNKLGKPGASRIPVFEATPNMIAEGPPSKRAVCPEWTRRGAEPPATYDERRSIDDAIDEPRKQAVRTARGLLLAHLAAAARALPGDAWIAGERVRLSVDQGDSQGAIEAAIDCHADRASCAGFAAYAHYAARNVATADSLFTVALGAMSVPERCVFSDISFLLDVAARSSYTALSCAQRDSVAARVWWLADPLYSEPGNERRAEHLYRQMSVLLHRAAPASERWKWSTGDGGRSLAEMLSRYGWPTLTWWFGENEDWNHAMGYIKDYDQDPSDVFTTAEYSFGRYHVLADWSAVLDPWHALPSAWSIAAPDVAGGGQDRAWWPQEHYARDNGPLIQIQEQQTAMLRRRDAIELAIASNLARVSFGAAPHAATGALVVTRDPDTVRVARMSVSTDSTAVWRTLVPSLATIVGIEVRPNAPGAATARTRYGIVPPATLSTMTPGEIAISDPILLRAAAVGDMPASDPSEALLGMLGTTRLRATDRVGVYWETYGITPAETVDVALQISRNTEAGVLRRLGTAIHVTDGADGGATIRWREPRPGGSTTMFDGAMPIQTRTMSIDLSRLAPGVYSLTVTMTRLSGQAASATRAFEIVSR